MYLSLQPYNKSEPLDIFSLTFLLLHDFSQWIESFSSSSSFSFPLQVSYLTRMNFYPISKVFFCFFSFKSLLWVQLFLSPSDTLDTGKLLASNSAWSVTQQEVNPWVGLLLLVPSLSMFSSSDKQLSFFLSLCSFVFFLLFSFSWEAKLPAFNLIR